jgi:HEPN domain-containing protein
MMDRAKRWLEDAESALKKGNYDDATYLSQMSVETAAKAVLIALAIDYPKEHDVSGVFKKLLTKPSLPGWFYDEIPKISDAIRNLAEIRGLAAYGYEHGMTLEDFKEKAPEFVKMALSTYESLSKLIKEIFG